METFSVTTTVFSNDALAIEAPTPAPIPLTTPTVLPLSSSPLPPPISSTTPKSANTSPTLRSSTPITTPAGSTKASFPTSADSVSSSKASSSTIPTQSNTSLQSISTSPSPSFSTMSTSTTPTSGPTNTPRNEDHRKATSSKKVLAYVGAGLGILFLLLTLLLLHWLRKRRKRRQQRRDSDFSSRPFTLKPRFINRVGPQTVSNHWYVERIRGSAFHSAGKLQSGTSGINRSGLAISESNAERGVGRQRVNEHIGHLDVYDNPPEYPGIVDASQIV